MKTDYYISAKELLKLLRGKKAIINTHGVMIESTIRLEEEDTR